MPLPPHHWPRRQRIVAMIFARNSGVCHICGGVGATSADHYRTRLPVARSGVSILLWGWREGFARGLTAYLRAFPLPREPYASTRVAPEPQRM